MNWLRFLLLVPLLTVFGGWLLWSVIGAFRHGAINAGGTNVNLRKRPLFFWLAVVAQIAFAALAFWLALKLLFSA